MRDDQHPSRLADLPIVDLEDLVSAEARHLEHRKIEAADGESTGPRMMLPASAGAGVIERAEEHLVAGSQRKALGQEVEGLGGVGASHQFCIFEQILLQLEGGLKKQ